MTLLMLGHTIGFNKEILILGFKRFPLSVAMIYLVLLIPFNTLVSV